MYHRVFVAGTFDNIHAGHEVLLTAAFGAGDEVTIGLTTDLFVKNFKKNVHIKPFTERKDLLEGWVNDHGYEGKALIMPIDDPYEPAASTREVDILVVTPKTKARGEEINAIRKRNGLRPLTLLVVPIVPAQDRKPVSSTRIRSGEIDRAGRLILPDNLRPELAAPIGAVLVGDAIGSSIEAHRNDIIIGVGDITVKTLLTAGVIPSLSVVDFQVERKPYPELDGRFAALNIFRVNAQSGPGFIAQEAVAIIKKWATHPQDTMVVVVDGEEDLLALPAIAFGPIDSTVYYGQPGKGLVEVVVSQEKKNQAIALLGRFI